MILEQIKHTRAHTQLGETPKSNLKPIHKREIDIVNM